MSLQPNPNHRGDPLFLADLLRQWGITVVEMPGWKEWGNGDFGKIQGVIAHHTGANNTSPEFIARNPLLENMLSSQIHLSRDGVATLCGVGIAWHAGQGSYPGWPTNNANQVSIGIEAVSDGRSPWPDQQMVAYRKICAAILWYLGYPATTMHLLGHKEYAGAAQGKWDPGGIDMNRFRNEVQWYIDNPPFLKEGSTGMNLDDMRQTYVYGSDFKDKLGNFILHADKNSYLAWQLCIEMQKRQIEMQDQISDLQAALDELKK